MISVLWSRQVETDPIPHLVIDVRTAEEMGDAPLPQELASAVHIPPDEVRHLWAAPY